MSIRGRRLYSPAWPRIPPSGPTFRAFAAARAASRTFGWVGKNTRGVMRSPRLAVQVQLEVHLREDLAHEEVRQPLPHRAVGSSGYWPFRLEVVLGQRAGVLVQKPLVFTQGSRITRPDMSGVRLPAARITAGVPLNSPAWMPAVTSRVLPGSRR